MKIVVERETHTHTLMNNIPIIIHWCIIDIYLGHAFGKTYGLRIYAIMLPSRGFPVAHCKYILLVQKRKYPYGYLTCL